MRFNEKTGPKPSIKALKEASRFARESTGDWMAVAMCLRPHGATQAEIVSLLEHPHRNKINRLVKTGLLKKIVLADKGRSSRIKLVKSA